MKKLKKKKFSGNLFEKKKKMRHKVDEWRHDLMPNWGNPNDLEVCIYFYFIFRFVIYMNAKEKKKNLKNCEFLLKK